VKGEPERKCRIY